MLSTITTENYEYSVNATGDPAGSFIGLIVALAFYLVVAYFYSRMFEKAGIESWKGWVPVVNNWHIYKLGGFGGWWAILGLIPFVNFVALIILWIAFYRVGKGFGKPGPYVLMAIFSFLLPVWAGIIATDSSRWQGVAESAYPARV